MSKKIKMLLLSISVGIGFATTSAVAIPSCDMLYDMCQTNGQCELYLQNCCS